MTEKQKLKSALLFYRSGGQCTGDVYTRQGCNQCLFGYVAERGTVLCAANDAIMHDGYFDPDNRPAYIMPIVTKYLQEYASKHPKKMLEELL